MRIITREIECSGRADVFNIYALGDIHIGALNCKEDSIRKIVAEIKEDPNALWVGGGDYCDAVILGDSKRFDVNTIPSWMLKGDPSDVRQRLKDILKAQQDRFKELLRPIADKCIGMIEGNHEYSIMKYHNRDHMQDLCDGMEAEPLTDCAFIKLRFVRKCGESNCISNVVMFVCHGHGGGRTAGAEPNKLARLGADKIADIILTGHSHTYHILPPLMLMGISGSRTNEPKLMSYERHIGNWGSFVDTYAEGPSTYSSRALYPSRPMYTIKTVIAPHKHSATNKQDVSTPIIKMEPVRL